MLKIGHGSSPYIVINSYLSLTMKNKCKIVPLLRVHAVVVYGGLEIKLHSFLISIKYGGEWGELHSLAALFPYPGDSLFSTVQ